MLFGTNGLNLPDVDNDVLTEDASSLIMEMAILDAVSQEELRELCENTTELNNLVRNEIVQERTIVRLDKKAKLSKAIKAAEFEIAKEKNDRNFRRLLTVWRMERELEKAIHEKYYSQAKSRAMKTMHQKKVVSSPNALVKKAAAGVKSSVNPELKVKPKKKIKPMNIGNVPLAKLK